MSELIKCPGCGEEIADDLENCMLCGHKLSQGDRAVRAANETPAFPAAPEAPARRSAFAKAGPENAASRYGRPAAPESDPALFFEKPSSVFRLDEEMTFGGYFLIFLGGLIGLVAGASSSFYCLLIFVFSSGHGSSLSRDIPEIVYKVSIPVFFATVSIVGAYLGGSIGKVIYYYTKLPPMDFRFRYENYFYRTFLAAAGGFVGALIGVLAVLIFYGVAPMGAGRGDLPFYSVLIILTTSFGIYYGRKLAK